MSIYPSVSVAVSLLLGRFGLRLFCSAFRADVCPGACTLTLRCLHILIYEQGDQHNILVEVSLCFFSVITLL